MSGPTHRPTKSRSVRGAVGVATALMLVQLTACGHPEPGATTVPRATEGGVEITAWKLVDEFGALPARTTYTAVFPIENFGTQPIELKANQPSCARSKAEVKPNHVAPGQRAALHL